MITSYVHHEHLKTEINRFLKKHPVPLETCYC